VYCLKIGEAYLSDNTHPVLINRDLIYVIINHK
jgi:hypothetical protein